MNSGSKVLKIAAMPGDGIGKEVMPEGLRVLDARFGFELQVDHINWGSCDHYMRTGAMMPPNWKKQLQGHDTIYFGAVGWPATVPDHVSLWGSPLKLRREFDQYINLRPVRLFDGVPCPLAGRKAGDIDFFVVRETRGRIHEPRRTHLRRHRSRGRYPGIDVLAPRHRPGHEVRLRAREVACTQEAHGGHQVQRHCDQHAMVGRARRCHG